MQVRVDFLDHYRYGKGSDPLECSAWGVIQEISRATIAINYWVSKDKRTDPNNDERFVILRSTIRKITKLEESETMRTR
jgi:hypothetical protein